MPISLRLSSLALVLVVIAVAMYSKQPSAQADGETPVIGVSPVIAHGGPIIEGGDRLPAVQTTCAAPEASDTPPPSLQAGAWVVYDPASGTFLAGENEDERRFPASITKIATALIALERGPLDQAATVDVDWSGRTTSARLGLVPGMETSLEDLFVGMLTVSANDAAEEVAVEVAGHEKRFIRLMNQRAAELGMQDTHFKNPHGLDEEGHHSTAHDLALLAAEAMRHDFFRAVVGSAYTSIEVGGETWNLANTNGLLNSYEGATGIKTGTTRGAGMSLAASAERDGHEVLVIVLDSPDRSGESALLLDWAFSTHTWAC